MSQQLDASESTLPYNCYFIYGFLAVLASTIKRPLNSCASGAPSITSATTSDQSRIPAASYHQANHVTPGENVKRANDACFHTNSTLQYLSDLKASARQSKPLVRRNHARPDRHLHPHLQVQHLHPLELCVNQRSIAALMPRSV
jgi:hypothetical protein